jgi:hypothetical protein
MLLGVHEQYQGDNATTPEETKARYPRTVITREFKGGVIKPQNLVKSTLNLCQKVWDAGLVCNVSFKLSPAEVFDGTWQIYVQQLCRFLVDNGRTGSTVLTFWHEPEDNARDSYPNGTDKEMAFADGAEFVRYFNTLHEWCKSVSRAIVTSHAALGYGYRPAVGGAKDKSAWVANPDAWVTNADIHAIDIYSGRSFPLAMTLNTSDAFKRWHDSHPGRWGVSERGWTTDRMNSSLRVESVNAELAWLASLPDDERPVFYILWLTEGVENDPNLKPDAAMTTAINAGFDAIMTEPPEEPQEPPANDQQCPLCHGSGRVPLGTYNIVTTVTVTRDANS